MERVEGRQTVRSLPGEEARKCAAWSSLFFFSMAWSSLWRRPGSAGEEEKGQPTKGKKRKGEKEMGKGKKRGNEKKINFFFC